MRHTTSRDSANRHGNGLSRTTVESTDDTQLIQQAGLRGFFDEQMDTIEHVHPYGFTARPKKPTGSGIARQCAEAFLSFLGGNRSHGIAIVTADRRYRPNNLQEGEAVLHDDQQQQVYLSRGVLVINVPAGKSVQVQTADGASALFSPTKTKVQFGTASVTLKGGNTYLGAESASHAVVTVDGPSTKVFAVIAETDATMPAAAIAKRTAPQGSQGS